MKDYLEFEKPILEIQEKILRMKDNIQADPRQNEEIKRLQKKMENLQQEIFSKLTPWQKTQIARHPQRPNTDDYIEMIFEDFIELHGDRLYGDDKSMITGLARLNGRSVVIIGHQKGKTVKERIARNFGMPHPEGYRKALRVMQLAEKFNKPVITFVDTPGAYPGVGAEERGQSEAIARNLLVMSQLKTPILSVVIGEGGSGGALAISVADRILMLQYAVYSVISPEGCAAILWNDSDKTAEAADALKMTATDLIQLGIVDEIIPEPAGGAHRDPQKVAEMISKSVSKHLADLESVPEEERLERRYRRLRKIGQYTEEASLPETS
ncbi:MAG TPA: acetyl-CoA carboxylase carboxyltransferase subunit alpha [Candidatus Manganitrophaceae bacterium]|nr:acetyl-CoA carboxylase carboxyltransferase subunit alpha [Candidatus Manganitrophaceae bacterium]